VKIRSALLALAVISLGLIFPSLAHAHTVLIGSNPSAGATVAQLPEEITLTFANSLLTLGKATVNKVEVIDPMGAVITSKVNVVHGAVLTNVLSPSMVMSGKYSVQFRVAAQDGHVLNGSFTFFVGATTGGQSTTHPIAIPHSGTIELTAIANGKGVLDGVGDMHATANGRFTIDFAKSQFCYSIQTAIKDVTAAHIHAANQMNMMISDEIFLPLELRSINSAKPICQKESALSLATLAQNAEHYVFMLHTKSFPDGAVAGMLMTAGSKGLKVSGASVTAAAVGKSSAVALTIKNPLKKNIIVTGIHSAEASASMIFFDSNMCQGNTIMTPLSDILIAPGERQNFGFKYQGAMISGLKHSLSVGQEVQLTINWNEQGGTSQSELVLAHVIKAPIGLNFGNGTAPMNMPGM